MMSVLERLIKEFERVGNEMYFKSTTITEKDFLKFQRLTDYQNGLRFAIDLLEEEEQHE